LRFRSLFPIGRVGLDVVDDGIQFHLVPYDTVVIASLPNRPDCEIPGIYSLGDGGFE
jgi:hypothetical protein